MILVLHYSTPQLISFCLVLLSVFGLVCCMASVFISINIPSVGASLKDPTVIHVFEKPNQQVQYQM